ncbi:MAG: hypothetical protein E4H36_05430, partial [Spirochaetales bacterium]
MKKLGPAIIALLSFIGLLMYSCASFSGSGGGGGESTASAKMAEMPAPSTQPGGQASGISSEEISSAPAAEAADAAPQAPGEPSS